MGASDRLRPPNPAQEAVDHGIVGNGGKPRRRGRIRPSGGWAKGEVQLEVANWYNPEKGFSAEDVSIPALEHAKRFYALPDGFDQGRFEEKQAITVPGQGKYIPCGIGGQFLEWNAEGSRFKPVTLADTATIEAHRASAVGKATDTKLRESFGAGLDFDVGGSAFNMPGQNASVLWDTEFIPIMAGPFYKQLYIYDYLYMHARAFEMTNHAALAAAAVKIMWRFSLGRGLNFHIKHEAADAIWSEFWQANNMRKKVRDQARDLTWQGEIMWKIHEPKRGYVQARPIDPSTCWEVVTDPEDPDRVYFYHFQYPTPYQIWVTGKIPVAKYVIQQIPPTNIQHLKINCSSQEKRGRSDLFAGMPWIKRFTDFYNGATVKAIIEANLVNIITVHGDESDVQRVRNDPQVTILPPPGAVWVQNESVELKPTSVTMTASGRANTIGQELLETFAASMNLPGEYFNAGGRGAARATALVKTDPAVKTIEDRQQVIREDLEDLYDRVMTSALQAGRIPKEAAREDPEMRRDGWQDGVEEPKDGDPGAPQRARVVNVRS